MTESDDRLHVVDPMEVMRRLERTTHWGGRFSAGEAVAHIVQECLLGRAATVSVRHVSDWWVVGADVDWLAQDGDVAFRRIVSYPEAGSNSMRYEVALAAFAEDVLTAFDGAVTRIKGECRSFPFSTDDVRELGRRVVAFRSNNSSNGDEVSGAGGAGPRGTMRPTT